MTTVLGEDGQAVVLAEPVRHERDISNAGRILPKEIMQTGSSEILIGRKPGKTTDVPLWQLCIGKGGGRAPPNHTSLG
jgi:hypothetical protein